MRTISIFLSFAVATVILFSACSGNSSTKAANVVESEVINFEKQEVIQLDKPNLSRDFSLMKALSERQSVREYSSKGLTRADLSDLLWAANGINRPDSGKRTAASAMNSQDIDIYVCTPNGAFLYDAKAHVLNPVTSENVIPSVAASQDYVNAAPVCLVLVSDMARFGDRAGDRAKYTAAMDAGVVSQNIGLFCTAAGLSTVPRAFMDVEALKVGLKLSEKQLPIMNHPVGYKK